MIMTRPAASMRRERAAVGGWPEEEIAATVSSQRELFQHTAGPAWYLSADALHHVNWTDLPHWSPLVRRLGLAGPIEPRRGTALVRTWSRAFFDRALQGLDAPLLDGPDPAWPEVTLDRCG